MALNAKQERFVAEYLIDSNATQAAIRAGYSTRSAMTHGHRLLKNAEIQARLAEMRGAVAERAEVTAADWLREVALIAQSDIGEIIDFTGDHPRLRPMRDIPERARRAISSIKVKRHIEGRGEDAEVVEITEFKLWSKDAALEKLGKYLGLLKDRMEHELPAGAMMLWTFDGTKFPDPSRNPS